MNTTEDRLQAAIRETADEITAGSTRPLSLPAPAPAWSCARACPARRAAVRAAGAVR